MRRRAEAVCIRLGLLLSLVPLAFAGNADRPSQEDDILEAVFRYQFDHNGSGHQKSAHSYCLAVGDADPSDQFMQRFAHHKPPVHKASACHWTSMEVVDRSGKPALLFRISSIKWTSDTEVSVGGGYEEANLSASGNLYTVEKRDGRWIVTHDQLTAISKNGLPDYPVPEWQKGDFVDQG